MALGIAAGHGHESVILGAWGCGAFGNDSREIAELFAAALSGPFQGVSSRVVFAILDWCEDKRFIGPFIPAKQHRSPSCGADDQVRRDGHS
jgi:uncharacterized protein (TIGR02452 family)